MPFCTTKTSNFLVTCYFYGGIVACMSVNIKNNVERRDFVVVVVVVVFLTKSSGGHAIFFRCIWVAVLVD